MWIEVKYQVILFVSWKTELIHAACSTTVIHVLLQRNCSHDKLSIRQILLFIPNMKSKSACSLSRPTRTKAAGWRGTQGDYQRAVVRTTIQRCFQSCDTSILLEAFPCNCLETIRVSLASALTEFVAVSLSAHVLFASFSFYTLYPASRVCTNSHPSIPLFYFSILYIHVSSFLLSLIFCSPSHFPATTQESLGWWTTAGAGIHIYVSCPCWLSYNSHNNTEGTWVLYKHPTLAAVSATCEEWVDFRLFSCVPLY